MERGSSHLLLVMSAFFWALFSWVCAHTETLQLYPCGLRASLDGSCPSGGGRDAVLKEETSGRFSCPQRGERGGWWLTGKGKSGRRKLGSVSPRGVHRGQDEARLFSGIVRKDGQDTGPL